mgnify:CR=1 FL=1
MLLKDRIAEARRTAGLNKSELARRCNVDPSAINHLESGRSKTLSSDLLLLMSEVLGVDPAWLNSGNLPKVKPWQTLSPDEWQAIEDLRSLPREDAQSFYRQIARMSEITRALQPAETLADQPKRIG